VQLRDNTCYIKNLLYNRSFFLAGLGGPFEHHFAFCVEGHQDRVTIMEVAAQQLV
jgi:hypothetical protein